MTTSKLPISVFIIAKDEADRIEKPILSVINWVDEVIVIDSGSTDDTIAASEKLGARVVFNEWKGYGPQKVFGETLCRNNWLFNIDADEEVSEEMAEGIKKLFRKKEPRKKAFRTNIKILFPLEEKPPFFAPSNQPIRFYHKDFAGFKKSSVHDSVVVRKGRTGKLRGIIVHRCFRDLEHWCGKINFYSSMQAEDFVNNGRRLSTFRIIVEPFVSFLKAYFLRRYFLYGVNGFVGSFLYAHGRLLRLAKARELIREKKYSTLSGED